MNHFCFIYLRLREAQSRVKIKKRVPLRPGRISAPLPVPDQISRPSYVGSTQIPELSAEFQVHDSEGISGMRAACQLAARALELAGTFVRVSAFYPLSAIYYASYPLYVLIFLITQVSCECNFLFNKPQLSFCSPEFSPN